MSTYFLRVPVEFARPNYVVCYHVLIVQLEDSALMELAEFLETQ